MAMVGDSMKDEQDQIKPVVPQSGIVLQEEKSYFVLCKPRLLPLKSLTLGN